VADAELINRLARLRGIGDAYHDYRGELKFFSQQTKAGILSAMGCAVQDAAALAAEVAQLESVQGRKLLPAVATASGSHAGVEINVAARDFGAVFLWSLRLEDGSQRNGRTSTADCAEIWRGEVAGSWITRRRFDLPCDLPPGYHELEVTLGGAADRCALIACASKCYQPAAIREGRKLWGLSVQLYTLRSRENWGIGDFGDLGQLIRWAASFGAGFIGLNPLHALAPADPARSSPYSPSSRHFLNVMYIAVPAVAEFQYCEAAQRRAADPAFAARLSQLRSREHVDYAGVAESKFEILALLYQDFRVRHLGRDTERALSFERFVGAGGAPLQLHARFDALDRFFRATTGRASGWLSWPEDFRDLNGAAAARFAGDHPAEVEFYVYLQWLASEQLAGAQSLARELGMPIGLYGDYAVGANPSGSETWMDPGSYCLGAEIGAPPDPLALKGQGWGTPPPDPAAMQAQRLEGFSRLIRNNMRHYGALRLDHVMSLFRLWWVPAGLSPAEGAYVHYPLHLLLTVLSLESERRTCLIVGEDLGVVPDEMRHAMPEFGLYHYKVMLFEKTDNRFRRPDEYSRSALATPTTHDLPTLRSFWEGHDIALRRSLGLYPSAEIEHDIVRERAYDRERLLTALKDLALNTALPANPNEPFTAELVHAVHLYLARSAAAMVALQLDDLLCMSDPVNVPGTSSEFPNWQRKLTMDIEDLAVRQDLAAQLAEIDRARLSE
jgi:4-alpha-glucanotransferase